MKPISEILGYATSPEQTNTDPRYLVAGSQNVLIDYQKKVRIRNGNARFGAANTALTPVKNSLTWFNSTGGELPIKTYDDELEVYLGTVDGVDLNAFYRVMNGLTTTEIPRFTTVWKDTETLDVLLFVQGNAAIYEWSGAVCVVDSVTSNTITKKGTNTFAQNRFYTVANRTLINVRTGAEFTYTGGTGTTTLTGVTGDPTADIVAGDVLVQKVVTNSNAPAANRNNHTIFNHENQIYVGSEDDSEVYISKNTSFIDYTYSTPRVSGEGGILTLTGISKGFGSLSTQATVFAGKSDIFVVEFEQITVSSTLAETIKVRKLKTGVNQGCISPETIVPIGNALIYLSNEPALRLLEQGTLEQPQLKTLSNPIKPDFDAEDFTNACAIWWRNAYFLSSPVNSKLYILEYKEDADGKIRRFWQPPQIMPIRSFFFSSQWLYFGSNGTPETFKIFDPDTLSDLVYNSDTTADEKVPINAIAKFAYNTYDKRDQLKNVDEYFTEGELTPNVTDLLNTLNYDFNGAVQVVENTIDGSDEDIIIGQPIIASLGQNPLAQKSLASALKIPDNARKFRVIFEIAKEDFTELQAVFSTNELDRYWAIISHGGNVELSKRRNILIKK